MDFFKANIIPGEVFVQLVAFLIVFFTLKKLAWGPILESLKARRERIKGDFDAIEKGKSEIESLKAEYSAHLQRIEEEARSKMQEAIEEGRRIGQEIQDKARSDAQEAFEKNKENLTLEVKKARIELRREIADLSLKVSEKIIGSELTEAKQQGKIEAMIDELNAALERRGE